MSLTNRVKRLERVKAERPCATCGDKGKWVVSEMQDGDPAPSLTDGCPECGKADRIFVVWTNEAANGGRACPN